MSIVGFDPQVSGTNPYDFSGSLYDPSNTDSIPTQDQPTDQSTPSDASRPTESQSFDPGNTDQVSGANATTPESNPWTEAAQTFGNTDTNAAPPSNPWSDLSTSQDFSNADTAPPVPPEQAPVETPPEQNPWADLKTAPVETPQINPAGHDVSPQEAGTYNPQGVVDDANNQQDLLHGFEGTSNDLQQKRIDLEARAQQYLDEMNNGTRPPDPTLVASLQGEDRALRAQEEQWLAGYQTQQDRANTSVQDAQATIAGAENQVGASVATTGLAAGALGFLQTQDDQQNQIAASDASNINQANGFVLSNIAQNPQGYFESLGLTPSNEVTLPNGQTVSRLDDGNGYSTWTLPGHDDQNIAGYFKDSNGNWNPATAKDLQWLHDNGFAVTSKSNAQSIASQAFQSTGTQPADLIKGYSEAYAALSGNGVTNTLLTPIGKAALASLNTRAGQAAEMIITAAMLPTGQGVANALATTPRAMLGQAVREAVKDTVMISLRDALKSYLVNGPDLGLQGIGFKPAEWLGIQDKGIAAPPIGMLADAVTRIQNDPKGFAAAIQANRSQMPADSLAKYAGQVKNALFTDNVEDVARQQGLANVFTNVDPAYGLGAKQQGFAVLTSMLVGDIENRTHGWTNINPTQQFQDYLTQGKQNIADGMTPAQAYQQAFNDTSQRWAQIFWEFNLRNPTYNIVQSPKLEDFIVRAFGTGGRKLADFGKWAVDQGMNLPGGTPYRDTLKYAAEGTNLFFRRLSQEAGLNAVGGALGEGLQTMVPGYQAMVDRIGPVAAQRLTQDAAKNFGEMILAKVMNDDPQYIDLARHHMNFFDGIPGVQGMQTGIESLVNHAVDGIRVAAAKDPKLTMQGLAQELQQKIAAYVDPTLTLSTGMQQQVDAALKETNLLYNNQAGADVRRLAAIREIKNYVDGGLRAQFGLDSDTANLFQKGLEVLRTSFLVPSSPFLAARKLVDEFMRSSVNGSYGLNPGDFTTVQNLGAYLRGRSNTGLKAIGESIQGSGAISQSLKQGVAVPNRVLALRPEKLSTTGPLAIRAADRIMQPGKAIVRTLVSETTRHAASNVFKNAISNPDLLSHAISFEAALNRAGAPQAVIDRARQLAGNPITSKGVPNVQAPYYQTERELRMIGAQVGVGNHANAIPPSPRGVNPSNTYPVFPGRMQSLMDRITGRVMPVTATPGFAGDSSGIGKILGFQMPKTTGEVPAAVEQFKQIFATVPEAEKGSLIEQFATKLSPGSIVDRTAGRVVSQDPVGKAFLKGLEDEGLLTRDRKYGQNVMKKGAGGEAAGARVPVQSSAGPARPIEEDAASQWQNYIENAQEMEPTYADEALPKDVTSAGHGMSGTTPSPNASQTLDEFKRTAAYGGNGITPPGVSADLTRAKAAQGRNFDPSELNQFQGIEGDLGHYGIQPNNNPLYEPPGGLNLPPLGESVAPVNPIEAAAPKNPAARGKSFNADTATKGLTPEMDIMKKGNPESGRTFVPAKAEKGMPTNGQDIIEAWDDKLRREAAQQAAQQYAGMQPPQNIPGWAYTRPGQYGNRYSQYGGVSYGGNPLGRPPAGPPAPPTVGGMGNFTPHGPGIPPGLTPHTPQQYNDWADIFREYGQKRMDMNAQLGQKGAQAINRTIGELGAHSAWASGPIKNLYPFADFHLNSTAINAMNLARRPLAAALINNYLNSTVDPTDPQKRDILQRTTVPGIGSLDKFYTLAHMIEYGRNLTQYGKDVANAPGNNVAQKALKIGAEPFVGSGAYLGTFPWIDRPANVALSKVTNPLLDSRGGVDWRDAINPNQDYGTLEGLGRMGIDQLPQSVSQSDRQTLRDKAGYVLNPGGKLANLLGEGITKGLNQLPGKDVMAPEKDPLKDLPYRARDLADQMGWGRGDTTRIKAAVDDVTYTQGRPVTADGQDLLRQIQYAKDQEMAKVGTNPLLDPAVQAREKAYQTGPLQTQKDVQGTLGPLQQAEADAWQAFRNSDPTDMNHKQLEAAWRQTRQDVGFGFQTYDQVKGIASNDPNSPVYPTSDGTTTFPTVKPATGSEFPPRYTTGETNPDGSPVTVSGGAAYPQASQEDVGGTTIAANLKDNKYAPQSVIESNILAGQPKYSPSGSGHGSRAESQFSAQGEENTNNALEVQRAATLGNYLSSPDQLTNSQLSPDQQAFLGVKQAGQASTTVGGKGTPITVNELLNQPGNYYDTIGKAVNESDPAKKAALFSRADELKNQTAETTALFKAQQDAQWPRLQLRRDDYLSRPDVTNTLTNLEGTGVTGVKNGQGFSYNPIHDEALQARSPSTGIARDKLYWDSWNDSQRSAYDQYNAYLDSPEHRAYKALEDQLAKVGGYDSTAGKAWYKENVVQYLTAENAANARLANIQTTTGQNPLEMASAVAVAQGKPGYSSTKIPDQKTINQYPTDATTGTSGTSGSSKSGKNGTYSTSKGKGGKGYSGYSPDVQSAIEHGNTFFDFWQRGDLTSKEKAQISAAERDVRDVLGKGKKPSADQYDKALTVATERLRVLRQTGETAGTGVGTSERSSTGYQDTSGGYDTRYGTRPDLIAQYGLEAARDRVQPSIDRRNGNPISAFNSGGKSDRGGAGTGSAASPWANLGIVGNTQPTTSKKKPTSGYDAFGRY